MTAPRDLSADLPRWGVVSTIKAPLRDILGFAAHHLELGAHRLLIFLDDPAPATVAALKAHPRIRVFACDDAHWRRLGVKRPAKHQARQTANATFAYGRKVQLDWIIHIDVDEFLWPETSVADRLAALDEDVLCARVRPMEQIAGDGNDFKAFIPPGPGRAETVRRLYPTFGDFVKGGFMSHVQGKVFVRTGLGRLTVKIHNVFRGDETNPGQVELRDIALAHAHAKSWEDWIAAYRYRLEKGSYRAELAPARPRDQGGMTLHEALRFVEADSGEAGLRAFYDEICAATPEARARLHRAGMLRRCELDLDRKIRRQFPDFA
ncbi:glycosyltransferase family 2 protein [Jhaorihella thermophila]|uniref:Glycosyl transferase family 2 n=1 Tax=Jhaorihella thermophila TaxID=488547 RepID=A0A1H5S7F2_9RHOB|nr:glycosyltransferase family 2 protein [Jhaorihella thermophila]SEF45767.1 Glycosyl transferase family 2 [Jhaorihella thermophila]